MTDLEGASSESQVTIDGIATFVLTAVASVAAELVEATSADGAEVTLDGSTSEFPEGAVVRWLEDGTISPVIDTVFTLEKAATAHQYIADRKNIGKVLLSTES